MRTYIVWHATKAEVQADGQRMAKADQFEHLILNQDADIGSRNRYGNDPLLKR